jgi:hypothetical protein
MDYYSISPHNFFNKNNLQEIRVAIPVNSGVISLIIFIKISLFYSFLFIRITSPVN